MTPPVRTLIVSARSKTARSCAGAGPPHQVGQTSTLGAHVNAGWSFPRRSEAELGAHPRDELLVLVG